MQEINPVKYEIFRHRLHNIAEEGRIALQRVSASPIVVQGGECMSAFYAADGTTVLSASGHLRFSAGCAEAVRSIIQNFKEDPGIFDGDQYFLNDPYIASTHVYDQMIVKPLFYEGELVAWTGSMTHTADTGGLLRGASTEIYHEGIRIQGVKLVEKGKFRPDIFRLLTEQCRDPQYVGLDLKSRMAANNVCARGFLQLVGKYGKDFIISAMNKILNDSGIMAENRLRTLPDGEWQSFVYGLAYSQKTKGEKPFKIQCKMIKEAEQITFDFAGTSSQNDDSWNATYVGSWGQLFVALTSQLFWDIPWNDGMTKPVKLLIPEGTMLNCKFPAACGLAPMVGGMLTSAASECIAKMLFAGRRYEDVNATWYGTGGSGGPGIWYGGHNQYGFQVAQGEYNFHGSGFGAAPYRDGVSTGGHMNNPTIGISDIERNETNYPFLYFSRKHRTDSGGYGKYIGGLGSERVFMVYGSKNLSVDFRPYDGIPGGFGLFGGYPVGDFGERLLVNTNDVINKMRDYGTYPTTMEDAQDGKWGKTFVPQVSAFDRVIVPEFDLMSDCAWVGGGFGDPLERDSSLVRESVLNGITSIESAENVFGVVIKKDTLAIDDNETRKKRDEIKGERIRKAVIVNELFLEAVTLDNVAVIAQPHEYLEIIENKSKMYFRCKKCENIIGPAEENYKLYTKVICKSLEEFWGKPLVSGDQYRLEFREYICPSCATLLQVDSCFLMLKETEPIWDIKLKLEAN